MQSTRTVQQLLQVVAGGHRAAEGAGAPRVTEGDVQRRRAKLPPSRRPSVSSPRVYTHTHAYSHPCARSAPVEWRGAALARGHLNGRAEARWLRAMDGQEGRGGEGLRWMEQVDGWSRLMDGRMGGWMDGWVGGCRGRKGTDEGWSGAERRRAERPGGWGADRDQPSPWGSSGRRPGAAAGAGGPSRARSAAAAAAAAGQQPTGLSLSA
eukprot:scaffold1446_cov391-Prasinococcus_capsulatus_cf.AAC.30